MVIPYVRKGRPFTKDKPSGREEPGKKGDNMSVSKIQTVVENTAMTMKVAGALMLSIAVAPITAFGALLAGCAISVVTSLRAGDHSGMFVNAAFAVANALGIARAFGLMG